MIKKLAANKVRVCCGKRNCPEVEKLQDGRYQITDDDGNVVIVKKEELQLMGDAVTTIDKDEELLLG
tara:strand:- start:1449 stop:1649 length:201 start_codon:yes stop_codon:yes gene_type:complete